MKTMQTNLDKIKILINQKDFDWILVIEGYEGIGKTTLAWHICKYIDPNFTAKNIVFDSDQFRLLLQNARKGTAILIDEGAFLLFSRNAMQGDNKEIIQALTMIRAKNLFICICVPVFQILDLYVREHRVKTLIKVMKRGWYHAFSKKKIKQIYQNQKTKEYIYPEPSFKDAFPRVKGREWQTYLTKKGDVLDRSMKWHSPAVAAKKLRVTSQTIRNWCRDEIIECEKTHTGRWKISSKELNKHRKKTRITPIQ